MTEEKQVSLDEIIGELAPEEIQKKVIEPHAKAHEKFKLEKISVDSFEDFKKQLISYMKHHNKELYKTDMPDEIAYGRAEALLDAVLRNSGGFKGAYKIAREGRLRDVIETLSGALRKEHEQHYTRHVLRKIDPFDFEKHVSLAKEYSEIYKPLLKKAGIEIKKPEEMAKDYETWIQGHVDYIESLKEQMGKYKPKESKEK